MNILNIILSVFIMTFSVIISMRNLTGIKINAKMVLIYFILMFPLLLLINLYCTGIYKVILIVILMSISLYFTLFNRDMPKSLYYCIIFEMIAFIAEIICSVLLVLIFNFSIESYNSFSFSMLIFSILNALITYFITKIKFIKKIVSKFREVITRKFGGIFYIIVIFAIMTLTLFFNKVNLKNNLSFYINVAMTIFIFITLVYIILKDLKNEQLEKRYNESMEYVQKYEKIINEQGKRNHEYNNQLMVIKGYINNKKKLEEYLDLIINEHKCGQNYTIRQLSYFPDGGIKGLIYHKIGKMEDNDIKYYLYIDNDIKNIFEEKFDVKTYQDITKLLGVFLDNAIEATIETDPKEIEIEIKNDNNTILINIINTFDINSNVKQIGKKGYTTKGKGHGYGLSIVKDIIKHNNKIDTLNEVEDNKFKQTIIIYYNN